MDMRAACGQAHCDYIKLNEAHREDLDRDLRKLREAPQDQVDVRVRLPWRHRLVLALDAVARGQDADDLALDAAARPAGAAGRR